MTTAIKSVSVSLEMIKLAEDYHLSLTEAVRVGLSVMLAEKGEPLYVNRLNVYRKIQVLADTVENLNRQIEEKNVILAQK